MSQEESFTWGEACLISERCLFQCWRVQRSKWGIRGGGGGIWRQREGWLNF